MLITDQINQTQFVEYNWKTLRFIVSKLFERNRNIFMKSKSLLEMNGQPDDWESSWKRKQDN